MSAILKGVDDRLIFYFNQAKPIFEKNNPQYKVIISEGIRSKDRQKELYAKGRKWDNGRWIITNKSKVVTMTMKSKHLEGKAIDVAFIINGRCDWSVNLFQEFAEIIDKLDVLNVIEWGGNWKSFKDYPHFQVK